MTSPAKHSSPAIFGGRARLQRRLLAVAAISAVTAAAWIALLAPSASGASYGVMSWGANEGGQLGAGRRGDGVVPVATVGLGETTAISAGEGGSLALMRNGTVMAWGVNNDGQLGIGNHTGPEKCGGGETACSVTPIAVSGLSGVTAISSGKLHNMALLENGTVMTWGENKYGQLGDGTTSESDTPVAVTGLSEVTAISADGHHSLALLGDGQVMAWGATNALGIGTDVGPETCGSSACSTTPVAVQGLSGVIAISAGEGFNLALLSNGTVEAWGDNSDGQLGDGAHGSHHQSDVPVKVSGLSGVTAISAGFDAGMALLGDRTVVDWGANNMGELGNGTKTNSDVPVKVSGLSAVTAIAAGERKNMALLANGTVMTWGVNKRGQLGVGQGTGPQTCAKGFPCTTTPLMVSDIGRVREITAGGQHSMASDAFPTVTGVSPQSGPFGGKTSVTITGTNFEEVSAVHFGSSKATSFTVSSEGSITAIAPPGKPHSRENVTVTTSGGTSPLSADDEFYYRPRRETGAAPPIFNVPYGPDGEQTMDVYPASTTSAPLVVLVHGGGWAGNDKSQLTAFAEGLQAQGFATFNIDYRLDSPAAGAFPMEVEDVEAATQYAIAHAGDYDANPSNVIYVGGSAGGQLVGMAAERLDASVSTISAVVTLSGAFDFPTLLQDDREGKLAEHFSKHIQEALGCSLETSCQTPEMEAWARGWSPAEQVSASCPGAWLIFNSEDEEMPLDQPQAMTTALAREGCSATEETVPGKRHAFLYWNTVASTIFSFIRGN